MDGGHATLVLFVLKLMYSFLLQVIIFRFKNKSIVYL